MLEHGGNLNDAVAHYGIARRDWLDLSTGINPWPYPVAALPTDAWHRLPEPSGALLEAACACYGANQLLPVAGTQAAIQGLPQVRLREHGMARVVVAAPSYAEHAYRWQQAGHTVAELPYALLESAIADAETDVVLVCNPNNPTGATVPPATLLDWAQQLAARGGWLIVDEAFADTTPHTSVAAMAGVQPGLIVLRSVGKFFGLAGARLGFVAAATSLLEALQEWLGPWSISGPAQQIGTAALRDLAWQTQMRERLLAQGERLSRLLARHAIDSNGSALYQWWPEPAAPALHDWMARQGIWVRLFTRGAGGIRLGLPPDEAGWQRLESALQGWSR
ncbi:cobalamin biosynthetic protein CobC [Herbaspirillum sp. Sphag1AN]|uniref:threonine-phosphate decarboxylase CobD n=1 Tax=unclassified Herbaspirillum TaxID=2624150 RepID=UPI00160F6498|nr:MULTISPECIES: threonine-phosphate decarboxylase CobD [unclassified Herbaspirillum]MBB3213168.1 cobalamin biosynthetic protein CobC [Herbaspirillum sp. Sphag1AN]MBB3246365.1 cobalamin biosynthetic protein CobC [Herbaspirillum sp. Sphag64]